MADGPEIADELRTVLQRFVTLDEKLHLARGVCETRMPGGGEMLYEMTLLAAGVKNDLTRLIELTETPAIAEVLGSTNEKVEVVFATR